MSRVLRPGAYLALLLPTAVAAVVTSLFAPDQTYRRWTRLSAGKQGAAPRGARVGTRGRLLGHAVASVFVGLVGWVLLAMIGLMIARGALYGVVDRGPYDNAWGGPSRAGAWLTHFAISVPIAAVAVVLVVGVANLHLRMTRPLHGEAMPRWTVPVVLVMCGAASLFLVGWVQQI